MDCEACHAPNAVAEPSPREAARALIFKIGVRRIAHWCDIGDCAVYKWFERATDDRPVPLAHVPKILKGAREAGIAVDPRVLWPSMPEAA